MCDGARAAARRYFASTAARNGFNYLSRPQNCQNNHGKSEAGNLESEADRNSHRGSCKNSCSSSNSLSPAAAICKYQSRTKKANAGNDCVQGTSWIPEVCI